LTFTGQTFPPNPGPQPGTRYQYSYDLLSRPLTLQMESSPEVWITLAQGAAPNEQNNANVIAYSIIHELGHALTRSFAPITPVTWALFNILWERDTVKQGLANACFK
jgi:hypothetical protein